MIKINPKKTWSPTRAQLKDPIAFKTLPYEVNILPHLSFSIPDDLMIKEHKRKMLKEQERFLTAVWFLLGG